MDKRFPVTLARIVLCVGGFCQAHASFGDMDGVVVNLEGKSTIKEWFIAGTFPSPEVDKVQPDGTLHLGFYKDYLTSLGGETEAVLTSETVIAHEAENGETLSVPVEKVVASDLGVVDLDAMFGNPDNVMAYAFCYVNSDKDQDAWFSLGSDDGVKVWVNGELVHSNYIGRGMSLGQDKFSAKLHEGNNTVLVKVIDMVRGWEFAVEVLDKKAHAAELEAERDQRALIDSMIAEEKLLWPNGIENNIINYDPQNIMKTGSWHPDAPLQISRAYANVSTPTYFVYQAPPEKNTGVGIVVLPGGGYNDVWLDTEGHNIALHFQERGITALVVKYRTNSRGENGRRPWSWEDYMPAAIADAHEGIRILRSRSEELNLDPNKIGVGGFSAGGHLALSACVKPDTKENYPDFAFLIYPWLEKYSRNAGNRGLAEGFVEEAVRTHGLPPMFIVNGQEDSTTPADDCAQFYYALCRNNVPAELHIYTKGTHGFTLGFGQGHSTVQWPNSFVAWLKDIRMIQDE